MPESSCLQRGWGKRIANDLSAFSCPPTETDRPQEIHHSAEQSGVAHTPRRRRGVNLGLELAPALTSWPASRKSPVLPFQGGSGVKCISPGFSLARSASRATNARWIPMGDSFEASRSIRMTLLRNQNAINGKVFESKTVISIAAGMIDSVPELAPDHALLIARRRSQMVPAS